MTLDVAVNEWHLHVCLEDADSCNDDQLRQAVVYYDHGTRLFEATDTPGPSDEAADTQGFPYEATDTPGPCVRQQTPQGPAGAMNPTVEATDTPGHPGPCEATDTPGPVEATDTPGPCVRQQTPQGPVHLRNETFVIENNFTFASPLINAVMRGTEQIFQLFTRHTGHIKIRYMGTIFVVQVLEKVMAGYWHYMPANVVVDTSSMVLAPMPALSSLSLSKLETWLVAEGQEVMVLEAMKMQNSLVTGKSGKVCHSSIPVTPLHLSSIYTCHPTPPVTSIFVISVHLSFIYPVFSVHLSPFSTCHDTTRLLVCSQVIKVTAKEGDTVDEHDVLVELE
ncbi:hypothetical protein NP493_2319g00001 [Ridgeia piscesae]|uniref:Propionyl-coenzyme A carboxylase BT domain-containing protein n=1 Tax=Ridgeia piscesae TaxID=27915 RepID=A0AAD9N2T4_RIDPI|nr:hypothetical protein NP493_2319g00001 [Ridgeia piscesae]